jgi:hypothetical protein
MPLAHISVHALLPSRPMSPWALGSNHFRGCYPSARVLAYLRIAASVTRSVARLASGPPGLALTGRGSHPLDGDVEFQGFIRISSPLDLAVPGRFHRLVLNADWPEARG